MVLVAEKRGGGERGENGKEMPMSERERTFYFSSHLHKTNNSTTHQSSLNDVNPSPPKNTLSTLSSMDIPYFTWEPSLLFSHGLHTIAAQTGEDDPSSLLGFHSGVIFSWIHCLAHYKLMDQLFDGKFRSCWSTPSNQVVLQGETKYFYWNRDDEV
jgi:hypothetical protein